MSGRGGDGGEGLSRNGCVTRGLIVKKESFRQNVSITEKSGEKCVRQTVCDSGRRQERVLGRALWVELNTEKALGRASK